ncbi:hypothetical protein LTSEMIN_2669, partial [Salmonella enterica subsp. enterica serovar Minnesota str. A4-603]
MSFGEGDGDRQKSYRSLQGISVLLIVGYGVLS